MVAFGEEYFDLLSTILFSLINADVGVQNHKHQSKQYNLGSVTDIELIRENYDISDWLVFGGSCIYTCINIRPKVS